MLLELGFWFVISYCLSSCNPLLNPSPIRYEYTSVFYDSTLPTSKWLAPSELCYREERALRVKLLLSGFLELDSTTGCVEGNASEWIMLEDK